jgi:hypothetical protein
MYRSHLCRGCSELASKEHGRDCVLKGCKNNLFSVSVQHFSSFIIGVGGAFLEVAEPQSAKFSLEPIA